MKYQGMSIVAIAQERGSSATTRKGAWKYIMSHLTARNTTPLEKRGNTRRSNNLRGHKAAQDARYLQRACRIASASGMWAYDDACVHAASIDKQIFARAESDLISAWPYKKSESRWAGGDHHVSIAIGRPDATGWSTREWSGNGKWSGTDSHARLTVSRSALVLFPSLMTPDGLALVDAEQVSPREYRITWVEQGRGFDLKTVSGWLIRGTHVKAPTLAAARKKVAASRKQAAAAHLAARMENRSTASIWVGLDDSFAAGNCRPSTMAFYETIKSRYGAEVGGLRADELLKIRDDFYTRRAISAAAKRMMPSA